MSSKVDFTTFDRHDPRAVAEFWATALAYEIEAPNEGAGEVLLIDPNGDGSSLGFMRERLVAAGASVLEARRDPDEGYVDPHVWSVMQDPEGNEFCVLEPVSRPTMEG